MKFAAVARNHALRGRGCSKSALPVPGGYCILYLLGNTARNTSSHKKGRLCHWLIQCAKFTSVDG